jgi:hypothetical protein
VSPLRDLFASLWAALWLRGRLLGIRLRRLFGSGRPAEGGPMAPDYHLAADEVPVEGRDYDLSDLPPDAVVRLDAFRAALVDHAGGVSAGDRPHRRARRRTISVAAASLLALGVAGGGASAIVTGSTGVPAIDRALGLFEAGMESPTRPGPTKDDLHLDASRQSTSVEATVADGSRLASSFYVADSGQVCSFTTTLEESGDGARLRTLACQSPADISERVATKGVFVMATQVWRGSVILRGYVKSETASLSGRGPVGPLRVSLGDAWKPDLSDLDVVKPFVAIGSRGDEASQKAGDLMVLAPDLYTFQAQTDGGDQVQISP